MRSALPDLAASGSARMVSAARFGAARGEESSAEQCAHPGEQLGQTERLGEVVVGADVEADHPVELAAASRQDHAPRRK